MSRITKSPEERRAEILKAAGKLFLSEGYATVSISRIVREIGVAQGTFYYYFESKEKILEAIIDEYIDGLAARFDEIGRDFTITPLEALEKMVQTEMNFGEIQARELFAIEGVDMHTRIFSRTLLSLAGRYVAVIERGIAEKLFTTLCPDLVAETIILHVHFLFDRDVLGWTETDYQRRLLASSALIEVLLEIPEGSLDFIKK